jgi:hypothetical protein
MYLSNPARQPEPFNFVTERGLQQDYVPPFAGGKALVSAE